MKRKKLFGQPNNTHVLSIACDMCKCVRKPIKIYIHIFHIHAISFFGVFLTDIKNIEQKLHLMKLESNFENEFTSLIETDILHTKMKRLCSLPFRRIKRPNDFIALK